MTTRATHDPSLDAVEFPAGRWLVLGPGDVLIEGDLHQPPLVEKWRPTWWPGCQAGKSILYIRPL